MKVSIILDEIDYAALPNLFVSEDDGSAKKLMGAFLKGGISFLPQQLKDRAVIRFVEHNKTSILNELNSLIQRKKIKANIRDICVSKCDCGINVISSVDGVWKDIAVLFLDNLLKIIPKKESTEVVFDVLDIIGDKKEAIAYSVIETLDNNEKTEALIVYFVRRYRNEICNAISNLLAAKNISTRVTDLSVEIEECEIAAENP